MTERDVVLRERAAFKAGASFHYEEECREASRLHGGMNYRGINYVVVGDEAKSRYALPTVTRTRVVADPHAHSTSWTIRDGELTVLFGPVAKPWSVSGPNDGYKPTPERITLWADLLAQPTETVDA